MKDPHTLPVITCEIPDWARIPEPPGWRRYSHPVIGDCIYRRYDLQVIYSASVEDDGKRWEHVSVSRCDGKLPTWRDLQKVKDDFIGEDKLAIQVLPPRAEHFSVAEVLHLWHCLDGRPLPDFRKAGQV